MGRLQELALGSSLSREEERKRLKAAQQRLLELRLKLAGITGKKQVGPGVLILFEGWDASGKGGIIKRLAAPLDPRHVHVFQFAEPSEVELQHHFLWRFARTIPRYGGMSVLDRSWYGRVLVERVTEKISRPVWERGYEEIVGFERGLAMENTVVVKFFLHISRDEQLKRFERRRNDPLKSWKLTPQDWANFDLRSDYEEAIENMLIETDHPEAPWNLIDSECKRHARVKVLETVCDRMEQIVSS